MMNKTILVILSGILLIAGILRFINLERIPNGISADEAAFGYNAYSLLQTGRDEFGYHLPLYLRSFDDYKNPLFGYVLIPFIAILGINEWSIRVPSALAGVALIAVSYFLVLELTRRPRIALETALIAAISPWLIFYSRVGIDMNLALLLSLLGVWFFLKGNIQARFYVLSAIVFGLSFYTYHSSKVWAPIFFVLLPLIFRRFNRNTIMAVILFFALLIPYAVLYKTSDIGLRPYAISVFNNPEEQIAIAKQIQLDKEQGKWVSALLHNRRLLPVMQAVRGYARVVNPQLFFGMSRDNTVPEMRLFYLWQLPLAVLGFISLFRNRRLFFLSLIWFLVALIPGGLTILPPFDRRILLASFPVLLWTANGIQWILWQNSFRKIFFLKPSTGPAANSLRGRNLFDPQLGWDSAQVDHKDTVPPRVRSSQIASTSLSQNSLVPPAMRHYMAMIFLFTILIAISFSLFNFLHFFYVRGQTRVIYDWGNGMRNLVANVEAERAQYDKVVISLNFNQPLTYFLFFTNYPPQKYLEEGGTISGGYTDERNQFANYRFAYFTNKILEKNVLYVGTAKDAMPCLEKLRTVTRTNDEELGFMGVYNPRARGCSLMGIP